MEIIINHLMLLQQEDQVVEVLVVLHLVDSLELQEQLIKVLLVEVLLDMHH